MPRREPPSGFYVPMALLDVHQRQNPDAAQGLDKAGPGLVVLSQRIELAEGQGISIFASSSGRALEQSGGTLIAQVRIQRVVIPPVPPLLPLDVAADSAAANASARPRTLITAYVPDNPTVPSTVDVELFMIAAASNFDIGSRPSGGCALWCAVVDLADFSFVVATP